MKRLYGKYNVDQVLLAHFPDTAMHTKRLAQLLPKASLGAVAGAAVRLCGWEKVLDRVAPGTYRINQKGKERRTKLLAALQKEGIRP